VRGRAARLVALATALLLASFAIPQPTAIALDTAPHVATYSYDVHHHPAPLTDTTTERGPPSNAHGAAADPRSCGAAARLEPSSIWAYTTYGHLVRLAQADSARGTTRPAAVAQWDDLRSGLGAGVAVITVGGARALTAGGRFVAANTAVSGPPKSGPSRV
jgi:hypothetical protein